MAHIAEPQLSLFDAIPERSEAPAEVIELPAEFQNLFDGKAYFHQRF